MPTLAWNEKAHLKWATPKMGNALQIQDVARGFWQLGGIMDHHFCRHAEMIVSLLVKCGNFGWC
jgi:hypothetical protein